VSTRRLGKDQPAREYTRREILRRAAGTGVAATAAVGLGLGLSTGDTRRVPEKLQVLPGYGVEPVAGAAQMAIARGADPAENVRRALAALGGMAAFVRKGEKVLIKPNVGWNRLPQQAANTNPEVVAEVVRQVKAAGAAEVWVADVSVNDARRCFKRSGVGAAAEQAGAELVLPDQMGFREVSADGVVLGSVDVLWPFLQADRVINLPVVKQHGLCMATLAMKNWYGAIGGHRARLHQDIHRSIVDLAAMVRPTLTVLDATRVLRANGPSGGSLDDVQQRDTIAAGVNEVALDAFGATLLDLDPMAVEFIAEAERRGLGTADFRSLKLEEIAG